jgi:hypothetical protein
MSIKKKFATAVATAGLLAGLFGSALVPSALARGGVDATESAAFLANEGDWDSGQIEESAIDKGHNDRDLWSEDAGDPGYELGNIRFGSFYGMVGRDSSYDNYDANDFSIGFYVADDNGDPITLADLSVTASGDKAVEFAWAYRQNGDDGLIRCESDKLDSAFDTTSDQIDNIETSAEGGDRNWYGQGYYWLCIRSVDVDVMGDTTLTVKANDVTISTVKVEVIGDVDSLTLSTTYGNNNVADNNNQIGNFWTVIAKDAEGQALNANGDGYWTYLNDITNEDTLDSLDVDDVTGGTRTKDADGNYVDFFNGTDGWHEEQTGLMADVCDLHDVGDSLSAKAQVTNLTGDVVRSNAVSLKCTEANTESVVTDYTMEYAASNNILTGEATWDASTQGKADKTLCEVNSYDGAYDQALNGYQGVSIYAIVKDTEGNLMGIDDSTAFSFGGGDPDIAATNSDLGVDDYSGALTAGGKVLIGCINPDMSAAAKYKLTVTTENPDTSESDEDDLVESFYYVVSSIDSDYSLTRVRNAAKTSATWTADFGLECSNAIVYFDWENADGTKGTFSGSQLRRRADFDGVATLTLNKRNMVVFVTAYACDDFSDPADLELGPLKARFK